jgi:choline kinase
MKAVILSAGQGKRLMPLTANTPKCLVNIAGQTLIEWQINELHQCGITQISVVVGYQADQVRQVLHSRYDSKGVRVLYNPTFAWADNLFSCWVARQEMDEDFILLNGDTIFESAVLNRLLQSPFHPITVVTHQKQHYDADDMKVVLNGDRLARIGKDLAEHAVDGESIGMILFRREGAGIFLKAVENAMRDSTACRKWYLSVIDELARTMTVKTCPANGLRWCEVDFPADLSLAREVVRVCDGSHHHSADTVNRYAWG